MDSQTLSQTILRSSKRNGFFHGRDYRILVLAPSAADSDHLHLLEQNGFTLASFGSIPEVCEEVQRGAGALLLEADALGGDAGSICDALEKQPAWSDIPITLLVSAHDQFDPGRIPSALMRYNLTFFDLTNSPVSLLLLAQMQLRSRHDQYRIREESLRSRNAEQSLQEIARELDSFTYTVSHDLKNPLNAVQAMVDVLRSFYFDELDADGKRCINEVEKSRVRMTNMINDLLRLSRISRHDVESREIDMTMMAKETFAQIISAEPTPRKIKFEIQEDMKAHTDITLLRSIVENILRNAIKYTAHTENPSIEVGMRTDQGHQQFFFRDNGVGFDPQLTHKLFRPFQRLHDTQFPRGTGVGLSIAERSARKIGGRIWAESTPGSGATFFLELQSPQSG